MQILLTGEQLILPKRLRKSLLSIVFIIINIIVVYFIAKETFTSDTEMTFSVIVRLWLKNWPYLLIVIFLPILGLLVEGLKYYLMIYHITGEKHLLLGIKTAVIGKYYDNITPLGSGGQAMQIYYLYKHNIPSGISGALTISSFSMMQIAFSFIALVVFIFFGDFIVSNPIKIAAYIGALFAIFIPLMVVLFSLLPKLTSKIIYRVLHILNKLHIIKEPLKTMQKVLKFFRNFKESFSYLSSSKRLVLITFLLSLIYQSTLFSIPYFVVKASGVEVDFIQLYALCVFVYSAVAFIPTPGNSGASEVSFTLIFTILSGGVLFWGMILWRFSSYFFVIIIGLITILSDTVMKKKKVEFTDYLINKNAS
jgi:uncharacterized protein (TIRG00374 family)